MFKAENFGISWLDLVLPFPCEIHHCAPRARPDSGRFSVLSHFTEPRQLKLPAAQVREVAPLFDLILTNEDSLLDLPNAALAVFGSNWVKTLPERKSFDVSFLYSNGVGSEALFSGYRDRRQIWARGAALRVPTRFYTSQMRPPEGIENLAPYPFPDKAGLFESMFSIIVENEYQDHYFTEKLIDCLRSYTVPIYFGAPNIARYFDPAGMLLPSTVDEMVEMIDRLTVADYWGRLGALEANYQRSKQYWDFLRNLGLYIEEGRRRRLAR
ncbi:hypothetical protein [Pelomonas sp. SE-A7]|uniref:hypothetical protein n=1 Tax=Pelomonas sp. SE-A7 TaxID=3054953 RepID=UPI00259D1BB6|nr:hypothetical protein [Pelomonas sp. SE-A7]MDM4764975.1 hypothetical protein [Pelomonas sp. SE-A7]